MCGTKTVCVSVTVCGCGTARKTGILKDSQRNVSVCSGYETISTVAIYITPHCVCVCVCVCFSTYLLLSAHSERCGWSGMWLPQVGFFLSSMHFLDPRFEVSLVRPSPLPAPPLAALSFSIYWLIQTWDFLYRKCCCPGSCGWVWYHQSPRIDRSPPEISSLHLCASRERKTDICLETKCRANV